MSTEKQVNIEDEFSDGYTIARNTQYLEAESVNLHKVSNGGYVVVNCQESLPYIESGQTILLKINYKTILLKINHSITCISPKVGQQVTILHISNGRVSFG